jgi:phage gp36-like protein
MFLTVEDYKAVCDSKSLDVVEQSDSENRERAESYAIEEMKGYLRAARSRNTGVLPYDVNAAFEATGAQRNPQLVMYGCDIALYHLISWLPQRLGFEIREIRYNNAIEWLENVQAGKVILDIPMIQPDNNNNNANNNGINYGSWSKNNY